MNKIAITIPTFLRFEKLVKEIESIPNKEKYSIYIGDQGRETDEKNKIYNQWKKEGIKSYYVGFNKGALYTRNFLINQVTEPYILVIDNDFIFDKSFNIDIFIEVSNQDKNIGIVAGNLANRKGKNCIYTYDLVLQDKKLYFIYNDYKKFLKTKENHYKYIYSDLVLNFFLAKTELFNDIKWDDTVKCYGHHDFFLRLKQTKWKVAYTLLMIKHQKEDDSDEYKKYRYGNIVGSNTYRGIQYFYKKWNLKPENIITDQNNPFIKKYKEGHND